MFHIRLNIEKLYSLPKDPKAIARRVDAFLEGDRIMCSPNGYEIRLKWFLTPTEWLTELWVKFDVQVPCASDCRQDIRKVFRCGKNARDAGRGFFEANQWYNNLLDVCDGVPCTAGMADRDM